jgi:preprotein translocase subunit SecY
VFNTLVQAFKNKELRRKIIFTLIAFVVFKIMTFIHVPLVDPTFMTQLQSSPLMGFANALTGGALKRYSIVALGVSPYITASIVIQILQMDIVPILSEWSKEGETGKQKIQQVTRYSALGLAFIQALAMAIGFDMRYHIFVPSNVTPLMYVYVALVMTAGTAAILWIADQITNKGFGNGTSMIIMGGIVSRFPYMINDLFDKYIVGYAENTGLNKTLNKGFKNWIMRTDPKQALYFALVIIVMLLIIVAVIFMQNAIRKIPIQYANRANSATLSGKKDSHLPIKLNPSGVIPVIFASSLLSLPQTVASFATSAKTSDTIYMISSYYRPIGFVLYVVLIFLFSFFYAFVQISPEKVADNLKKQGSYIPGVRPGKETENFISGVLLRTTVVGSAYLMLVAVIPIVFATFVPGLKDLRTVTVGGTSLLIVVGVAQQLFKQIESKSKTQKYSGFIK